MVQRLSLLLLACSVTGCAVLHKTQISEIDNRNQYSLVPFEIKVSETGVDLKDVQNIARSFKDSKAADKVGDAAALIGLFQMGPKTGAPVYVEGYAKKLIYAIHQQCPNGGVTGVTSVRETRKYPVISGEIVRINGYCLRKRAPASETPDEIQEEEI